MAIGRYLAHRKTADGSYEDVYLKSESGLIYRPNGRTVEQDLAAYLPEYQDSDAVPESLPFGTAYSALKPLVGAFKAIFFEFSKFVIPIFTQERTVAKCLL